MSRANYDYFKFGVLQLKQFIRGGPQIIRVSSKNGSTFYRFRKFEIEVKTLSQMEIQEKRGNHSPE